MNTPQGTNPPGVPPEMRELLSRLTPRIPKDPCPASPPRLSLPNSSGTAEN